MSNVTLKDAVHQCLARTPGTWVTAAQIMRELAARPDVPDVQGKRATVDRALRKLRTAGFARSQPAGKCHEWCLTPAGLTALGVVGTAPAEAALLL